MANASLSITFKTASILFASEVMKLKYLPTTYFTALSIQTKNGRSEQIKSINRSILKSSVLL